MTEFENAEEAVDKKEIHSFGERLFAARKSRGFNVADIAKAIHLSEDTIDALERSDVSRLPQPAFVKGYLRTYAKHLGIPEAAILEEYSRAVPHSLEVVLRPRSILPDEAHSGSPFIKSISTVLLILMILAAVYGAYSYYSEILESRNDAEESSILTVPDYDASTEDVPYQSVTDGEYISESQDIMQTKTIEMLPRGDAQVEPWAMVESQIETPVEVRPPVKQAGTQSESKPLPEVVVIKDASRKSLVETQPVAAGDDSLELIAHEDSWTEVVDANDVALLYDLVKQENTVVLRGTAPFDIFLGNAPAMEIRVNGIKIDMTKFVRSNKIAHFYVSTNDQQVVFH